MPRAISPFTVDRFDSEPPYHQHGEWEFTRTQIAKSFSGDLRATSQVEMLAARAEGQGAGYVAVECVEGTLQGRAGTFALLHMATQGQDGAKGRWLVVPGSGTGELSGLSGEARIEIDESGAHALVLDYQFD
ncbi:MAG: DUF3224 domain-containing protein [Candidatus Dormibacteria bacterium]